MLVTNVSATLLSTAEAMPEGSILHFDKSFLIETGIYWVNIMLLIAVLAFLLYKPVKRFMQARTERIQKQLAQANDELEQAKQMKRQYEEMIRNIAKERDEILLEAHKRALAKSDDIIAKAHGEAEIIHEHALEEIRRDREHAQHEVKKQIIDVSMLVAGRFIEASINRETQDDYVNKALAELEEGAWHN